MKIDMSFLKRLLSRDEGFMMFAKFNNYFPHMPDSMYVKLIFRVKMGKKLNLENPRTFNEKLQWLKLYNRKPEYTLMVDKYRVKKYVAEKMGKQYVVPTLGVWKSFDDIDFSKLPDKFVLKCNHDSGGLIICRDKSSLDLKKARRRINRSMHHSFYLSGREWPYKNVRPLIIAEKYISDSENSDALTDYKFFCFDGKVDCVMVCIDRNTKNTKFYFFDRNWKLKRINKLGKAAPACFTLPKPEGMDKMFELAAEFSKGIPFVRIDFYSSNGNIYFGEFTFFPSSGFDPNLLEQTDRYFGSLIKLER